MLVSPYFFYGSAIESTHQSHTGLEQYALYSPIPSRFCLTYSNKELLKTVAMLFSSRYSLHVCRLDSAENFGKNLIDNESCFNWSPESTQGIGFTRFLSFDEHVHDIQKLRHHEDTPELELLYQDREYLWAAAKYIRMFETGSLDLRYKSWIEEDLREFVDLPISAHPVAELKNKIFSIIYHEFDFESAKQAIKEISKEFDYCDIENIDLRIDNWV